MGPSTDDREVLGALIDAGMDVARFNFSHGSYEEHKQRMNLLKEIRREKKKRIEFLCRETRHITRFILWEFKDLIGRNMIITLK